MEAKNTKPQTEWERERERNRNSNNSQSLKNYLNTHFVKWSVDVQLLILPPLGELEERF